MGNERKNKMIKLIPIFYTNLPSEIRGRSYGLFIQIDKKYKDNKGLLKHEREHSRQFLQFAIPTIIVVLGLLFSPYDIIAPFVVPFFGTHWLLYRFSKKYKYWAEVKAFGYSIAYGDRTKQDIKHSLKTYYKIPSKIMQYYESDIEIAIEEAKKSR